MSQQDIPDNIHALVMESFGPASQALNYKTVPMPQLRHPKDILIKVVAAGVNPIESKIRQGYMGSFIFKKNSILGGDYSGVVVAKGSKVTEFNVNDRVFGSLPLGVSHGSYAEYLVANTSQAIAKIPAGIDFVSAASMGIATLTAIQGLLVSHPEPIQKVLVIGASGGVGTYAIQIAKARGANQVVGVCSGKNKSLVIDTFGADRVVDYTDPKALDQEEPDSYDVVLDLIGGEYYYTKCLHLVKKKTGIFISAVGPVENSGDSPLGMFKLLSIVTTVFYRKLFAPRRYGFIMGFDNTKFASHVAPWMEQGLIKSYVPDGNVFDLKDGYKAHEMLESHRTVGKIVLRVSPDPST
ncbi:chaperonin 10-like protein [Chlamydoabsidia padenii]|nr:chaperonin 10-like protein [Chlamydoabsidia padenii]